MKDWLIIVGFVLMLLAPCLVALVVGRVGKWQKEGLVGETEAVSVTEVPALAPMAQPVMEAIPVGVKAEAGDFAVMRNLSSGDIQIVRVAWSKQFDGEDYPRAGGRIRRRI